MKTKRVWLSTLLTVVALAVLTACGGGGGGEPVKKFDVSAVSPDIGMIGSTVTITGEGLEGASVVLGDVTIIPDSQSATKITFAISGSVDGGPQTLVVSKDDKSKAFDFFVGYEYAAPATLEDLEALNLPKGTAVRLTKGIYTSTSRVILQDLSLFGVSPEETIFDIISTNIDDNAPLMLFMDRDSHVVIEGIGFQLGQLLVVESTDEAVFIPMSHSGEGKPAFDEIQLDLLAASSGDGQGSLVVKNISVTDVGDGSFGVIATATNQGALPVSTSFIGSTMSGEVLGYLVSAELSMLNADFELVDIVLGSFFAPIVIQGVNIGAEYDDVSLIEFYTLNGLQISDSYFSSTGRITAYLGASDSGFVRHSSFAVYNSYGNMHDNPDNPAFRMRIDNGDLTFESVEFEVAGVTSFDLGGVTPRLSITNSHFTLGDPNDANYFSGLAFDFEGTTDFPFWLVENNGVASVSNSEIDYIGAGGMGFFATEIDEMNRVEFVFMDNEINGFPGIGFPTVAFWTEIFDIDGEVEITMTGNEVTGFAQAFTFIADIDPFGWLGGKINNNTFALDIDPLNQSAVAFLEGVTIFNTEIDARHNIWSDFTDTIDVEALIYDDWGGGGEDAFRVDPITPAP